MRFNVGRLEVRIHPLLPLALLLMAHMGAAEGCLLAFGCVLLHELGHLAAAAALGVHALALEIMPLGGVVYISGLYRLSTAKIVLTAMAGPLVSLSAALVAILFPTFFSLQFALMNLLLCAFNLLPGMPMDGGRVLAALLKVRIGIRRSVRIAVTMGRIIGALLLIFAAWLCLAGGAISLPVLLMGVYLLACAGREVQDCELSPAEEIAKLLSLNRMLQPLPVQAFCCERDIPPDKLLSMLRPDRCTLLIRPGGEWETDLDWLRRQISA